MTTALRNSGAPFDLYIKTQFDSLSPEDWEKEVYFPVRIKKKCFSGAV
jgi:hypothetical protein